MTGAYYHCYASNHGQALFCWIDTARGRGKDRECARDVLGGKPSRGQLRFAITIGPLVIIIYASFVKKMMTARQALHRRRFQVTIR